MNATAALGFQQRIDAIPVNDDWGVAVADLLLGEAIAQGYSDVLVQCRREHVQVLGRFDQELVPMATVSSSRRDLLVARLKVLCRLPAFVRNEPQDGRMDWRPRPDAPIVPVRAAFLPTLHGETVTLRMPDRGGVALELARLGMSEELMAATVRLVSAREGAVLVVGPSGSGKTTSLYAMLAYLNESRSGALHILTIEDPVERELAFATQVPVNAPQGLGFDRLLRASLRQSPDVLMIGEIRDTDSAQIAMQAGMTGHLVLSSMHASRAARVPTRLLSMGIEPYLVASALSGGIAQRLLRTVCRECRGAGCGECHGTGMRGRAAIFELVAMTERLRALVLARAAADDLSREAAQACRGDLMAAALALVTAGTVPAAELDLALPGDERANG